MFKKSVKHEDQPAWGVADLLSRKFLAGLFAGIAIGIMVGRLLPA